jgi:hypothetical protein
VSPGAGTNFVCGLGSGVTNIIGDYLTTNFIGVSSNGSFSIASAEFQNFTNSVVKKVGTAYTVGAALDNPNIKFLPVNAVATADRNAYYIEITKGSPNYTVDVLMGNAPSDVTAASFATEIVKPSPAFAGGVYSLSSNGAKAIAFDETAGTLNSVQCWWNSTTSLPEICDLAVVLLA